MSHANESCPVWMSHILCGNNMKWRALSTSMSLGDSCRDMNESCPMRMSHVPCEWVISYVVTIWRALSTCMSLGDSWRIYINPMRHDSFTWDMNHSYHMGHDLCISCMSLGDSWEICINRVPCDMNDSCPMWMSHVSCDSNLKSTAMSLGDACRDIDRKKSHPPGGFLFTMFPDQEPGGRGPPSKHLVQILRKGSSSSGFLIREHSK